MIATAVLTTTVPAAAVPVNQSRPPASTSADPGVPAVERQGPTTPAPFSNASTATPAGSGPAIPVPDGTSEVEVLRGRWAQVPGLPVRVRGREGSPAKVRVTLSSGDDVQTRGGALALLLERVDGSTAGAPVQVALQTSGLGEPFLANWIHRLRVTQVPACVALLHPHPNKGKHNGHAYAYGLHKKCPTGSNDGDVEVPVVEDDGSDEIVLDATAGEEISEEVADETPASAGSPRAAFAPHAAATTAAGSALLVGAGPSGSAGSFSATPLASSASWEVGEQSGDFTTSYDVSLPAPPAGDAPSLGLGYSSQSVDGRTSASNNQASWVGLGWELDPGSVQRQYGACSDDGHGVEMLLGGAGVLRAAKIAKVIAGEDGLLAGGRAFLRALIGGNPKARPKPPGAGGDVAPTPTAPEGAGAPAEAKIPGIETPYGTAEQSTSPAALDARDAVSKGATVFKGGKTGVSLPPQESQFLSFENPAGAGYGARYGIPPENLPFDWVAEGHVRPGAPFITREAPGVGSNGGGGIECVVNPGDFLVGGC